jgi:hypothetical protein
VSRGRVDLVVFVLLAAAFLLAARVTHEPRAAAASDVAERTVQGKSIDWWARHAVQARKDANARAATIRRLRRELASDTTIQQSIDLAAVTFHVDAAMLSRKASCESTGGRGYNPSATGRPIGDGEKPLGLFQFLGSTWRSTPYARFSPYNPLAAALAAGWMHSAAIHRGSEWQCR